MSKRAETGITLSCIHCGRSYKIYPPDTFRIHVSITEKDVHDSIKINYNCENCKKDNILYWGI